MTAVPTETTLVRILRIKVLCRACGAADCVPATRAAAWMSAHYLPEATEALAQPLDGAGSPSWWPLGPGNRGS